MAHAVQRPLSQRLARSPTHPPTHSHAHRYGSTRLTHMQTLAELPFAVGRHCGDDVQPATDAGPMVPQLDHFGPLFTGFSRGFSAMHHPTHAVQPTLCGAYWMLTGACNPVPVNVS